LKKRYRSYTGDGVAPTQKPLDTLLSVPENEAEDQADISQVPVERDVEIEPLYTTSMLKAHMKKIGLLNDGDYSTIVL
jgi:hypothetical protein